MASRTTLRLIAASGLIGTIALTIYFSAPFWFLPLPPPNAKTGQIIEFGKRYRDLISFDVWLQQIGSMLSVAFALGLVHVAGRLQTLAGRFVLVASTVILSLSLAEGTFILAAVAAGENGHYESAVTCVDLANVFIHIFLLAPSLFLMLGWSLWKSDVLPSGFSMTALGLGISFQILGVAGLFNTTAVMVVIFVLVAQNLWTIAASIALLLKRKPITI